MKHGKKYTEAAKLVDRATFYEPKDAIALVKKTATAKFDETTRYVGSSDTVTVTVRKISTSITLTSDSEVTVN
mgnify:CR=1 FL=1